MKLRIQGDSIRLRLTQSEVARFAETGRVEATTHFGAGDALTYALRAADVDTLDAAFGGGRLTVLVPRAWAATWADSDEVGIEGARRCDGRTLALLVEKDFECLHRRADEPDAFPHPDAR